MMRARRHVLLVVALLLAAGCGPTATQRALNTSLAALNAASDGFLAWDEKHQQAIVDGPGTVEEKEAKIAEYRAKRDKVVQGFIVAYGALAAAAADQTVQKLLEAAKACQAAYDLIKSMMAPEPAAPPTSQPAEG